MNRFLNNPITCPIKATGCILFGNSPTTLSINNAIRNTEKNSA